MQPSGRQGGTVRLQHLLPRRVLTHLAGYLAAAEGGRLTTWAIRCFIRRYGVAMQEAAEPDPAAYRTFNAFFTRALKPGVRPLAPLEDATWLCPVDGAISQFGALSGAEADRLIQAKGHDYSVAALLADTEGHVAAGYKGGHFATLYLSPRDYHRIHMPVRGTLRRMLHVPGDLYSVNPATAAAIPGLFARNERVVCHFDTDFGPFVLVLVGATIVGSMATVWHGRVNPPRPGMIRHWDYADGQVVLARGEEMGRFLLGSTVVMLWPRDCGGHRLRFNPRWSPAAPVRMGEAMAHAEPIHDIIG